MFLLVSGRHVGAHTDGHQHGVSLQISITGKKFLRRSSVISCIRKIAVTRILARVFVYLPSFISQILDLIYWTVLIFILIYFEWCDTENQQLTKKVFLSYHGKYGSQFENVRFEKMSQHFCPWKWSRRQLFLKFFSASKLPVLGVSAFLNILSTSLKWIHLLLVKIPRSNVQFYRKIDYPHVKFHAKNQYRTNRDSI